MNVIFIDFDGTLITAHFDTDDDIERRVKILADICHEYNSKVVIEAAAKGVIDEETLEVKEGSWVNGILRLFQKYQIECIGRTPNIPKQINENMELPMWKEDEILMYLEMHPEITHYCIIDDDDTKEMHWTESDLDKVRDHLVQTKYYSDNPQEEGLLPRHKEEVGKILEKEIRTAKKTKK